MQMNNETNPMIVFISESDGYRVRKEGVVAGFLRWDYLEDRWFFFPQTTSEKIKFEGSLETAKEQVRNFVRNSDL